MTSPLPTLKDQVRSLQMELARLQPLRSLQQAVETMQIGVTVTDLEGTILYTNPADAQMHGYRPEELVGKDVGIFAPRVKRRPMNTDQIHRVQSWRRESVNVRRDGVLFPVQLLSDLVKGLDGNPIGIVTTCEDITERKLAEGALSSSRANLAAVLENTKDAVWSLDAERRLMVWNAAFEKLFSGTLRAAPLAGLPWSGLVDPAERGSWETFYARALAGEAFSVEQTRSGESHPRYYEVSFNPIRAGDLVTGVSVFARDVTARVRAERALREVEERYEAARGANDGIWDWNLAEHEVYFSPRWKAMLGYGDDEIGHDVDDWISRVHPEDRDHVWMDLTAHIDGAIPQLENEHRVRHKDGSYRWMLSRGLAVKNAEGTVVRMAGSQIDVTERRSAVESLRESEERYAIAARGANDGLWDWRLATGEIYLSPRWKSMVGCHPEEIGSSSEEWFRRVHPDDVERLRREIQQHLDGQTPQLLSEHRMLHRDGSFRWMLCRGVAVRSFLGAPTRLAGSLTDITERKRAEEQLLHDAFHDGLTGLPNRALFMDHLGLALERSRRHPDHLFAVLFIDVDRFKLVNDSMGHTVGDKLLQAVAQRLRRCLRAIDTLARLGGDEFTLLLDGIRDEGDATAVAERVHSELGYPLSIDGQELYVSASIGIALSTRAYERAEDLVRDADTAMYRAKAQGRARWKLFDADMHESAVSLLQMETDLRKALERDQFSLKYQPIVSLRDGRLAGFEALARWSHPERGAVSPAHFIPLAEETGLILSLGHWALREACRQLRRWNEGRDADSSLSVSVNLSARQFLQRDLAAQVGRVLRETGLPPHRLALEITESVLMDDVESATAMLRELMETGIRLYLDDFGTGYSSLSYLPRFPIHALKIDRSFVSRMLERREEREIVRTILGLAHNLGKDVMAEGVETREQLDLLREIGCEYGQGYFFSQALTVAEAEDLIASGRRW